MFGYEALQNLFKYFFIGRFCNELIYLVTSTNYITIYNERKMRIHDKTYEKSFDKTSPNRFYT